jgi:hypothetical protein
MKLQFIDHGIEHEQYFQGCGVAFTEYDECFTGIGVSAISAIDDCLEQVAMSGIDVPRDLEQESLLECTFGEEVVPEEHNDNYYYVSLRIKR